MSIRTLHSTLSYLSREPSLRYDGTYLMSDSVVSGTDYYLFSELFDFVNDDAVNIESLSSFYYVEISNVSGKEDIDPVFLDYDDRNELNENYFAKIEKGDIISVKEGDILISKLRPYLKKIVFIDNTNVNYYYTSAFIHVRPKTANKILFYALKSVFLDQINAISRQGKGYPTLSEQDLSLLKLNKQKIDSLLSSEGLLDKINLIETSIANNKKCYKYDKNIINEAFIKEFKWEYNKFLDISSQKQYVMNFSAFGDNYDLRFSPKFHRPAGEFVVRDINKTSCLKIKNYLDIPIALGSSVSPEDFSPEGEVYYISMATVKNFKIELDDTQLLRKEYVNQKKNENKKVSEGDIIMTRSGAAIGKFALIDEDVDAIYSDFTMRIRLKNVNPLFAYYYFRSVYFQYLIEVNYKGLQNNNIFPNQVQEFPFPSIPLEEQERIVAKIKVEIDKQQAVKKQIDVKRAEIDLELSSLLTQDD